MSVLIKGVKMPKSCLRGGCPIAGDSCSLWEDKYWKSPDEPYRKRHQNCPLVPVLPHGDLIERDALAERLGITDMDCYKCAWGNHGFCGRGGDFEDACEAIEAAPTIIPAEEGEDG